MSAPTIEALFALWQADIDSEPFKHEAAVTVCPLCSKVGGHFDWCSKPKAVGGQETTCVMSESDAERIARQVRESRSQREAEEKRVADELLRELEGGAR